ncbi:Shisa member 4 [Branchiostoma belcheri]|nr:Shisa member 4 [Branchiostoma belcheri]
MSASVVLFVIVVLGTASAERCRGYTDVFGNYNPGFSCPTSSDLSSDTYCCGFSNNPYCCSSCLLSQTHILHTSDTPTVQLIPSVSLSLQYSSCGDNIIYLSTGAIVGIAVGCVVLVAIIITCHRKDIWGLEVPVYNLIPSNDITRRTEEKPTTTVIANQPAAGVTVAQTTYPGQPYTQYPPSGEMSQYPPPGAQYPPPGQQYPPQQGGLVYPPAYPGQGAQPMKQ